MIYEKSNLKIESDFEVREIQKDEHNVDLIVPIGNRCVNLYLHNAPKYMKSRVQFPSVKSILIRFCTIEDNNTCTLHFLSDSGIHSTMANFEMDYSETYIEVRNTEYFVDMKMLEEEIGGIRNEKNM
ncbi:hypothetical protein LGL55_08940 [Clostridium tagluense]|uniref:hypothetical protein n=1 Tax=Clostridium TaxID=1485 RepID=UPI0013E9532C|nr:MULTISPECIES: hypothetical protein [Clostridium]MBU3129161.1 hypothetical protein [Clostridium tagluense]MBW9156239.1 hypothetical protein [Clostridium tagluense]MBZ9625771.1 hypothetical protein [Clostridium sp. FP2]MCB2311378.1 hypothetical protein [Clostridium tagluense]MCB2315980.1 hypothetical protein [Clostridium tagluense]